MNDKAHQAVPLVCPEASIPVTGKRFCQSFESQFIMNQLDPDFADITAKINIGANKEFAYPLSSVSFPEHGLRNITLGELQTSLS